jgi:hypothetical protein
VRIPRFWLIMIIVVAMLAIDATILLIVLS